MRRLFCFVLLFVLSTALLSESVAAEIYVGTVTPGFPLDFLCKKTTKATDKEEKKDSKKSDKKESGKSDKKSDKKDSKKSAASKDSGAKKKSDGKKKKKDKAESIQKELSKVPDGWEVDSSAIHKGASEKKGPVIILFNGDGWNGASMELRSKHLTQKETADLQAQGVSLLYVSVPNPKGKDYAKFSDEMKRQFPFWERNPVKIVPAFVLTDPDFNSLPGVSSQINNLKACRGAIAAAKKAMGNWTPADSAGDDGDAMDEESNPVPTPPAIAAKTKSAEKNTAKAAAKSVKKGTDKTATKNK